MKESVQIQGLKRDNSVLSEYGLQDRANEPCHEMGQLRRRRKSPLPIRGISREWAKTLFSVTLW